MLDVVSINWDFEVDNDKSNEVLLEEVWSRNMSSVARCREKPRGRSNPGLMY
jgi:hypothetical protein